MAERSCESAAKFYKAESRIGVAKVIGRTGNAARPHPQVQFRQRVLLRVSLEILDGLAVDNGEDGIVRLGGLGQLANAVEIISDTLWCYQLARLAFALHGQGNNLPALTIFRSHDVSPAQVPRFWRAHKDHVDSEAELIEHCRQLTAGYKWPRSVEFRTSTLPLLLAGKILKIQLRAPFWETQNHKVA